MSEQINPVDLARKVLERDKAQRAEACERAIVKALAHYGCELDVQLVATGQGTWGYRIEVKAQEKG